MRIQLQIKSELIGRTDECHEKLDADYKICSSGFQISWKEYNNSASEDPISEDIQSDPRRDSHKNIRANSDKPSVTSTLEYDFSEKNIHLSRKGEHEIHLLFTMLEITCFEIKTQFGNFHGTIQTRKIDLIENSESYFFTVQISYDLIYAGQPAQRNDMELTMYFLSESSYLRERKRIMT